MAREFGAQEAVVRKRRLVEAWSSRSSEEILRQLAALTSAVGSLEPESAGPSELQLLRAVGLERGILPEQEDLIGAYFRCREIGSFQAALVLNNLGVLFAQRQACLPALDFFGRAVREALAMERPLRAPLENAVLIFHHLCERGLILQQPYLDRLDETLQLLAAAHAEAEKISVGGPRAVEEPSRGEEREMGNEGEPSEPDGAVADDASRPRSPNRGRHVIRDFKATARDAAWTLDEPREACKRIALYCQSLGSGPEPDPEHALYRSSATHVLPTYDVFASFGDTPNPSDREAGRRRFEQAMTDARDGRFGPALEMLGVAGEMNPELAGEAQGKVDEITEMWRRRFFEELDGWLRNGEGDRAADLLLNPPDQRLRRSNDAHIAASFRRSEDARRLAEAERLEADGDTARAKRKYVELLQREDLSPDIKKYASVRLARLATGEPLLPEG